MAILFFDGFDRCTVTKDLDKNYWSVQQFSPVAYEEYSFGGYSYSHDSDSYATSNDSIFWEFGDGGWYNTYSPNGSLLPTGRYMPDIENIYNGIYISGNAYPGFGSAPGFLALPNIDISDINNLTPISYVQLSGFQQPGGDSVFLTSRILGIETKDSSITDIDGRFGTKHPLVAFCNGDVTGLILNVVKKTANHLETLEGSNITMGLEVEQIAGVSGTFDLNINNDLANYKVRSVYSTVQGYRINDMNQRILTIDSDRDSDVYSPEDNRISPISRWCHFQFGIISTGVSIGEDPYIQIKLDDIDLLSIPDDDSLTDKDFWDDRIYLSGLEFDNIRFFNRTYNSNIEFVDTSYRPLRYSENRYYMLGALTLLDDIILSDDTGSISTFLGKNAKVIPFTPGLNRNLDNNGYVQDGLTEWDTNTDSYRKAVKNADGDDGTIFTPSSGRINAVAYGSYRSNSLLPDDNSENVWGSIQDGIGGIKVYNQAKKEFLDTSYINVIKTGVNDILYEDKTEIILYTDGSSPLDRTKNYSFDLHNNVDISNSVTLFNQDSIAFDDSYLVTSFGNLRPSNNTTLSSNNIHAREADYFVIESWVYFTGDQPISLFSKKPPSDFEIAGNVYSVNFDILCYRDRIDYNYYIENNHMSTISLFFTGVMSLEEWHHVALLRDAIDDPDGTLVSSTRYYRPVYPLVAFLDGVSGVSHKVSSTDYSLNFYNDYNNEQTNPLYSRYLYYRNSGTIDEYDIDTSDPVLINASSRGDGHIDGSGIYSDNLTGILSNISVNNTDQDPILGFDVEHDGNLYYDLGPTYSNGNIPYLIIEKNSVNIAIPYSETTTSCYYVDHHYLTPFATYNRSSGIISVVSGDSINFYMKFLDSSTTTAGLDFNIYISSGIVEDKLFYLDSRYQTAIQSISSYLDEPRGSLAYFADAYSTLTLESSSNARNNFPLFIGGNNILSNLRITIGGTGIGGEYFTRYKNNFDIPTSYFLSKYDDYIDIGSNTFLTKTRYGKTISFYEYNNPATNQPWTTGLIGDPNGLILGVKKT